MFHQLGSMTNSSMGLSPAVTVLDADHLNLILRSSMEEEEPLNPLRSSGISGKFREKSAGTFMGQFLGERCRGKEREGEGGRGGGMYGGTAETTRKVPSKAP